MGHLSEHLEDINKPEADGGQLKPDWDRIVYLITQTSDRDPILSLVPIKRNEAGEMVMERPLSNRSITDLFNQQQDGDNSSEGE
ncbi:MAG: hypothetical protein AAFP08_11650 [Bacteroidota bacterium]